MHLLKISIFSLNSDIIRLTKIMNNLVKDCKIRTFKVIFQCLKLVESFRKKNSVKNIWLGDQLLLMKFFENFDFQSTLFSKNMPNFCRLNLRSIHNKFLGVCSFSILCLGPQGRNSITWLTLVLLPYNQVQKLLNGCLLNDGSVGNGLKVFVDLLICSA